MDKRDERTIIEHYLIDSPDARTAIADEKWLSRQDLGALMVFQNTVHCLDTVLMRVMHAKMKNKPLAESGENPRALAAWSEWDAPEPWKWYSQGAFIAGYMVRDNE